MNKNKVEKIQIHQLNPISNKIKESINNFNFVYMNRLNNIYKNQNFMNPNTYPPTTEPNINSGL